MPPTATTTAELLPAPQQGAARGGLGAAAGLTASGGSTAIRVGATVDLTARRPDRLAIRPRDPAARAQFEQLLLYGYKLLQNSAAKKTLAVDKCYWRMWKEHCAWLGTSPLRDDHAANSGIDHDGYRAEVALASSFFIKSVLDNPQFKPESMLKRLRGVAREHRRHEIQFVSLSSVIQIVDAATKLHIQLNGRESVNPRQREPLTNAIICLLYTSPSPRD